MVFQLNEDLRRVSNYVNDGWCKIYLDQAESSQEEAMKQLEEAEKVLDKAGADLNEICYKLDAGSEISALSDAIFDLEVGIAQRKELKAKIEIDIAFIEGHSQVEVARDSSLKNDAQRKAKTLEIQQSKGINKLLHELISIEQSIRFDEALLNRTKRTYSIKYDVFRSSLSLESK